MRKIWSRRDVLGASVAGAGVLGATAFSGAWLLGCKSGLERGAALPAQRLRELRKVVAAVPTSDGAGVKLRRALGTSALPDVDPFLMLDEIRTDEPGEYVAGFPDHPHRGFETVTLMLDGAMQHKDSVGNQGRLGPGSVQWMTAGRGIVHSEMPQQERGLLWGFQLWVNLPASHKMIAPRYQDLAPQRVPVVTTRDGASVRVLAGEVAGQTGPVRDIVTAPLLLDITLPSGGRFQHALPVEHNAMLYVLTGRAEVGAARSPVEARHTAVLPASVDAPFVLPGARTASATELIDVQAKEGARFLLFAGRPIKEPITRHGPFVMNTPAEIRQAIEDYRAGRLGRG